jgi:hypothetical protein
MYTSVTNKKRLMTTAMIYTAAAVLCALFGAVYEYFGHGVYSNFMIFAFVIPLAFGALPMMIAGLQTPKLNLSTPSLYAYHSGIVALTVGSIFKGVLDIYGTTNRLISVYWIAGGALIILSLIIFSVSNTTRRETQPPK